MKKLTCLERRGLIVFFYYRTGRDDKKHILATGNFGSHIWKIHAETVGIDHSMTYLKSVLRHWKIIQYNNKVQKVLFQILPNFISWNLWKKGLL